MPKLKRPILESNSSVVRPVAFSVITEVMERSRIRNLFGKMNFFFPGENNPVELPRGNIDEKYEPNRFMSEDALQFEVTERYDRDLTSAVKTRDNNHIPLWINEDLEVTMLPIYAPVEMVFSIRYRSRSRAEARRFYDFMMMKLADREDMYLHEVSYHICIDETYMAILKEIYRLQELVEPYGETWEEFFSKSSRAGWREITDQTGKHSIGVWGETQDQCMGFWDLPDGPEQAVKEDGPDSYTVELSYVLRYERIKDVEFIYPISVHNQILSPKYRSDSRMKLQRDKARTQTTQIHVLSQFRQMAGIRRPFNDFPGRYFPEYDEFIPRYVYPQTMRVFTALVLLDETDALMNPLELEEIPDGMVLSNVMKAGMVSEAPWINRWRGSIFNLSLYQNRNLMDKKFIGLRPDLTVYCPETLSKRNYYHVRFSIITDLSILDEDAQERLKDNPDLLEEILDYIIPEGKPRPVVPRPITNQDWENIVKEVRDENGKDNWGYPGMHRQMRTVQTSRLDGYKEDILKRKQ